MVAIVAVVTEEVVIVAPDVLDQIAVADEPTLGIIALAEVEDMSNLGEGIHAVATIQGGATFRGAAMTPAVAITHRLAIVAHEVVAETHLLGHEVVVETHLLAHKVVAEIHLLRSMFFPLVGAHCD